MKGLGIGNAIVDVICKVEDNFITDNGLTKSTMKLVDEPEFKKLLSNLKIEETVSGGSVANSIAGLSQIGSKVGFIGKVNDDDLGQKYEDGLKKENVNYFYSKKKENLPTGTCLILITPDSERTMCTFLGTAGKINEDDVDINSIKNSEIIFLEGYLWDEGDPRSAFDKAIKNSNKVAMSLSDVFCVERHKTHFLELVKNKLDITFANEQEITSLLFIAMLPFSPLVMTIIFPSCFPNVTTSSNFLASISDIITCSFAKVISILSLTSSKKCGLCLSTQNKSDRDIATLLEFLIALSKAVLGSPSSHK